MRKRIHEIIDYGKRGGWASVAYEVAMLIAIVASIVPLMFWEEKPVFRVIEAVTVSFFILDYLLRWLTADYRQREGKMSFVRYPITGWAIVDLLSILPGLSLLGRSFKLFRITRLLRIVRLLKLVKYSSKFRILGRVVKKERKVLLAVMWVAVFYIFLTALIMFNAEPHINPNTGAVTFSDFFDALYWATVTLTTVGYGDMIPVTDIGHLVSMLSSIFGVAIIALPSGVITASYLDELRLEKEKRERKAEEKKAAEEKGKK